MVKYNKYKCKECNAEAEGVNDVDGSRGIVHKDGCTGKFDNIEQVKEKAQETPKAESTSTKKK